jgi:putative phosphoesterase
MTTRILMLSDTHVPQRARMLPPAVWTVVDEADLVIHAGDWNALPLLDEIEARASRLLAVRGNNDGPEFADRLPEVASASVDGIRFSVIHDTGQRERREQRMAEAFPETDVLVFGHSHIPWDTVGPHGMRLLNPGSPTDRRRQPHGTYLTAIADAGSLREVRLVPLIE